MVRNNFLQKYIFLCPLKVKLSLNRYHWTLGGSKSEKKERKKSFHESRVQDIESQPRLCLRKFSFLNKMKNGQIFKILLFAGFKMIYYSFIGHSFNKKHQTLGFYAR